MYKKKSSEKKTGRRRKKKSQFLPFIGRKGGGGILSEG